MKRILITGITGMTGSHLADYLLQHEPDCEIYGAKRWRSPVDNIAHLGDKVEFINADLTDMSACMSLLQIARPNIIFHLAANSFVLDSWMAPHKSVHDNIGMELNLFEAIRKCKLDPIVQIAGSSEQYGKVFPNEVPIREGNPFRPLSPYAVSKVTQDVLAYQYFQSYGLKAIRTRAFNHEGPRRGEVFVTSSFAKQVAEIELGIKPPLLMVGNLDSRRDWSDVRDVARAYWLAVTKGTPGEDYVIASGTSRSVREMLDLLLSMTKVKIDVQVDPARLRPSDVTVLEGDCSKFKTATGWEPVIPFEQTMGDLLDYWRDKLSARTTYRKVSEVVAR